MLGELREHEIGADARDPAPSSLTTAAAVSSQLVSMPRPGCMAAALGSRAGPFASLRRER